MIRITLHSAPARRGGFRRAAVWVVLAVAFGILPWRAACAQELRLEGFSSTTAAGVAESGPFSLVSAAGGGQPAGEATGGSFSVVSGGRLALQGAPAAWAIRHEPTRGAPAGRDLVVGWELSRVAGLREASLFYRPGGSSEYAEAATREVAGGTFASTIPAEAVSSEGIAYYLVAVDSSDHVVRSPAEGDYAASVEVDEPGLVRQQVLPGGTEASAYRLISIPLDLADKDPSVVLRDDLGAYGDDGWRFFELLFDQTNREYPETSPMAPGRAFWIISREPVETVDTGGGRSVDLSGPFALPLHPRWNLVGNPFNFPLPVEALTLGSGQPVELRAYEGRWNDPIGARVTALQPFSGYALFNSSAIVDTLYVDPQRVVAEAGAPFAALGRAPDVDWAIRIRAKAGTAVDSDNVAAVAADAAGGWDRLDYAEPPAVKPGLSVYFPHPEWGRLSESFSTDVRAAASEGEVWTFDVASDVEGPVLLTFDGLERLAPEQEAWLIDDLLALAQDLRADASYRVSRPAPHAPRRLRLLVGSAVFVAEHRAELPAAPAELRLLPAFPNPFRTSTTIAYGLPAAAHVRLSVFGVTGRRIATLVDAQMGAGHHSVVWDGRGRGGSPAASGVYFLVLEAGGRRLSTPVVTAQ